MATEKHVIPSLNRSPAVNSRAGHVSIRHDYWWIFCCSPARLPASSSLPIWPREGVHKYNCCQAEKKRKNNLAPSQWKVTAHDAGPCEPMQTREGEKNLERSGWLATHTNAHTNTQQWGNPISQCCWRPSFCRWMKSQKYLDYTSTVPCFDCFRHVRITESGG